MSFARPPAPRRRGGRTGVHTPPPPSSGMVNSRNANDRPPRAPLRDRSISHFVVPPSSRRSPPQTSFRDRAATESPFGAGTYRAPPRGGGGGGRSRGRGGGGGGGGGPRPSFTRGFPTTRGGAARSFSRPIRGRRRGGPPRGGGSRGGGGIPIRGRARAGRGRAPSPPAGGHKYLRTRSGSDVGRYGGFGYNSPRSVAAVGNRNRTRDDVGVGFSVASRIQNRDRYGVESFSTSPSLFQTPKPAVDLFDTPKSSLDEKRRLLLSPPTAGPSATAKKKGKIRGASAPRAGKGRFLSLFNSTRAGDMVEEVPDSFDAGIVLGDDDGDGDAADTDALVSSFVNAHALKPKAANTLMGGGGGDGITEKKTFASRFACSRASEAVLEDFDSAIDIKFETDEEKRKRKAKEKRRMDRRKKREQARRANQGGGEDGDDVEHRTRAPRKGRFTREMNFGNGDYYGEVIETVNPSAPGLVIMADGTGTYTFHNGGMYEGDFQRNVKTGFGKYVYPDGSVYEGNWIENVYQGDGKYTYPSGVVYEGTFVDGRFQGRGSLFYRDGRTWYEGDFVSGKKSGNGRLYFESGDGYFHGEFKNGNREGFGVVVFNPNTPEQNEWIGWFENDQQDRELLVVMLEQVRLRKFYNRCMENGFAWSIVRDLEDEDMDDMLAIIFGNPEHQFKVKQWLVQHQELIMRALKHVPIVK